MGGVWAARQSTVPWLKGQFDSAVLRHLCFSDMCIVKWERE